jgi:hypothetical protein
MASPWLDTTLEGMSRHYGETTSLQNLDHAAMLMLILGALIAWIIGEMLDL